MDGAAKAQLLEDTNRAKGIRVTAEAEADRVRQIGIAEADVIIAKVCDVAYTLTTCSSAVHDLRCFAQRRR
jgi:hypothetical protein